MPSREQLETRARELAPWHFDFELAPGLRTADCNRASYGDPDKEGVHVQDADGLVPFYRQFYPDGLEGKSVLDVGCNAGAYCFSAHELGASSVTGFDVRSHWIDQANFVREVKYPGAAGISFELGDAKLFLRAKPTMYDIVVFKGVFYHLPDPISVLYELAAATREVILVDTASSDLVPEDTLQLIPESPTHVMSGVDGIAWLPGGPRVLERMLRYCGFTEFWVPYWMHDVVDKGRGRFRIVARKPR
jgi:SAM-dependent methyltransferase